MIARPLHLLFVILAIASSAFAAPTTAPSKAAKPHEKIGQEGCVRAECHVGMRKYAVVHGPVGVNACDACHELTSAESHTFKLTREKSDLCTYCHEFKVAAFPVVHKPVKEGQCIGCHDPHGGTTKALLREKNVQTLCNRCHEDITHNKSFLHTPIKEGACDSCHPPHGSRFPKLLDLAGPDLCLACHDGFDASLSKAKFRHKALEKGCEKCHDPHGSKFVMSTTQPVADQCGGCHEKTKSEAMAARYPHTPVLSGDKACINCHTPHGGNLAKLVSDSPDKLCMTCHDKEQKAKDNRTVAALSEMTSPQAHKHGGIKDGSCAGCHSSHGGNRQLFLSKNYSSIFYQRFSPAQYELCFGCHDQKLVNETKTTKVTAFRNGDKNLHTLHVRDTRERGANCRVCHNTHAGENDRIVRNIVRYGTWQMPVRFKKTATGGACYPGCHPNYGYDRNTPVKNTIGQPTTRESLPIGRETPANVAIDAKDVRGASIKVPAPDRPTIIALLRTDQAQLNDNILDQLPTAGAQTVVLLSGPSADTSAASLASSRKFQFIADADGSLSSELDVRGWPTILVIKSDGLEAARIAGSAESLAIKLPAYLDLASGKIDATDAQKRATTRAIVSDAPDKQSAHDIRSVESLIDNNKPQDAIKLLMTIPDTTIPHWQHNFLGARALIQLNRWPEARDAAIAAINQKPDSSEAHYLLGQIYEHDNDWPHAAAEYRAAANPK